MGEKAPFFVYQQRYRQSDRESPSLKAVETRMTRRKR